MTNTAAFSPCGRYRYALDRRWGKGAVLPIVMLNPSTADATFNDPTISRCIYFARRDGFGGIRVANLFAFRATRPRDLKAAADPVGPDNDATLMALFREARVPVLAAWGAHGGFGGQAAAVGALAEAANVSMLCLGITKDGHPRHPLYVRGDRMMEAWRNMA